jgi:tight adherence protein B
VNNLTILLLFAFLGLSGLGFSALLVVRGQAAEDRLKQRLATATAPHLRIRRMEVAPTLVRAQSAQGPNSLVDRAAGVFGYNTARPDQYAAKWWVVVGFVAIVARLITGILVGMGGPMLWIAMPVISVLGSRAVFNMMLQRRRAKLYAQFPDCLAMIVRSVRAGVPLTEAIRIVAKESQQPSAEEFGRIAGDLAIGVPLAEALKSLADRAELAEFRFFATALTLQSQTGGRLGETLDNLAGIVRKRMALKSRAYAMASEARTTAYILGGLPVVAGGGLFLLNPGYVSVLFNDSSGRMILASAFTSLGVGAFIMRTIISKTLS